MLKTLLLLLIKLEGSMSQTLKKIATMEHTCKKKATVSIIIHHKTNSANCNQPNVQEYYAKQ
jgi:hypothetical protein